MSVARYPSVRDEFETVDMLLRGYSIARFGDGEVKYMTGGTQFREPEHNADLARELRDIVSRPHEGCLPGILTMRIDGPKYAGLSRHIDRFCRVLSSETAYYSSLISRPDCAPWIDTTEYAMKVQAIWAGKRAVVVCERKGSMAKAVRLGAKSMLHVECPRYRAYAEIDRLVDLVLGNRPDVVVLSAGLTATCMADRLSRHGVQAVDLGSAGRFLYSRLTE